MPVGGWLRDLLGINRYAIVWGFEHRGVPLKGRQDFRTLGGMSKRAAQRIADSLSNSYDAPNSHWVERA